MRDFDYGSVWSDSKAAMNSFSRQLSETVVALQAISHLQLSAAQLIKAPCNFPEKN
jgi:hypothetical protein